MKIFVMRHGEAAMEALGSSRDDLRPLTSHGIHQSEQMGAWVAPQISQLNRVLVSPFLRAQQTWQSIRPFLPQPQVIETVDDLVPYGQAEQVTDYLRTLGDQTVFIISHLPLVGYIVNDLCQGSSAPMFVTSGLACVEVNGDQGMLVWQENPNSIRKL